MSKFYTKFPSRESYWRSIILFGRNVASYKFALAQALLRLSNSEKTFVTLDELALPFATSIADHLKTCETQGTFRSSKFLDACRNFNNGQIDESELREATIRIGFNNVIDAFHVVNQGETEIRFFEDRRDSTTKGITITDDLLALRDSFQFNNLADDVDSRWRLVETAWELGVSRSALEVYYDAPKGLLYNPSLRRQAITSCRGALNGYQKGKCFTVSRTYRSSRAVASLGMLTTFSPMYSRKRVQGQIWTVSGISCWLAGSAIAG